MLSRNCVILDAYVDYSVGVFTINQLKQEQMSGMFASIFVKRTAFKIV